MLHLELRPYLICLSFPFPLLPTIPLNAFIYSPQLQREPGAKLLQPCSYILHAFHDFAIIADHALLRTSFVTKNISVPPKEDIIALVVHGDNLSALEFWSWRPKRLEEMGREETKGCAEVVENKL